ncbi:hypothetical protein ZYGR_0AI00700 [Zygosaccharomyces rouxii]|uniref:Structural maintenance of chromosomes protein n=1 Tax=Zygosaccharomyces rouxii TaxID=4956 RepID=A0A1Q3AAX9_ZYGRO|nr:hypothetical protein ZYGR_0AI00700 [Zygosaccharomyces rouxii]
MDDDDSLSKRQKIDELDQADTRHPVVELDQRENLSLPTTSSSQNTFSHAKTPRKLIVGNADNRFAHSSQSLSSSSLQVPPLQPPATSSRGRGSKTYSQSPPRSPARSPTRKLELIQISPLKNSRLELQKIYDAQQNQARHTRLCINQLILQDFKSYAGRQVVGPFNTSFSAVVGPNGSGKSNVIDSMLFVFGFRANKMRQDRLSDLIHKSEEYPSLQSCSVEVHFQYVIDEPTGETRIDEEKPNLIVTRKAFRNNTSKYYVNDQETNYGEVTKLLKKEGVDLDHKRFLILQGEVENIAQMKSKAEREGEDGLLEYLEDIIDTAKYKPLIEKNLADMESLNDICIEKENRFQIVDREKNSLENGKEEALLFLENERKLTVSKSKLYQYHLLNSNTKLKNTLDKITNLNQQLERESDKNTSVRKELDKLRELGDELEGKLKNSNNEEKQLLDKKRELDGKNVLNEEKIKNLEKKRDKAEKTLNTINNSISSSEANLSELKQHQVDYESSLKELNEQTQVERAKLEKIKFSLKDKTNDISLEIAQLEEELEPWNAQLQEKKTQIQLAESQISLIKETEAKITQDINQFKQEIETRKRQILQGSEKLDFLHSQHKSVKEEISAGEKECYNAKIRLKEMQSILNTQRQKALEARSTLSNAENKSKVLTALSRLQKSGRISGFHGRLGDLGVIDEKYDVAISTACPRLEDIVVETVECGQQCIEYLRKNKLGYARFILLDKLRKFNLDSINTPESVPRLFDLIHPKDSKFSSAFFSVLGNTLVANDLKQANRVAYGKRRFRVVTLDGNLIDISGTMSGGGTRVSRGLMQINRNKIENFEIYSSEEVAQLEVNLVEREKNFQVASDTIYQMEEQLKDLKEKEPAIENNISQLTMEIESWNSDIKVKEGQLLESEKACSAAQDNNEELRGTTQFVQSLKDEFKSIQNQTKNKKQRIEALKNEIMEIGGAELKIQSSKVDSAIQRIDIILSKQKRERSIIKKTENEIKKSHKIKFQTSRDLEIFNQEIQSLKTTIEGLQHSLNEAQTSIEHVQHTKENLIEESRSLDEKLNDINEDIAIFKSFELEMKNELDKLNSLSFHVKKEIKHYEEKLGDLKIRDVTRILEDLKDESNDISDPPENPLFDAEESKSSIKEGSDEIEDFDGQDEVQDHEKQEDNQMEMEDGGGFSDRGLTNFSEDELRDLQIEELEKEIEDLQNFLDASNADVDVLEEYARRLVEFKSRRLDLNQAVEERNKVKEKLDGLKKKRFDEFMQGFGIISMTLKEMYQMITMGGNAELELVDTLDPFSEGVTFSVMPPKKSWRNITNLSGGEKTLSSLALVFALHKYKPTPLYVMDEIDAALDFRNVSIVANYIKERTKNAQFIVISLRNNMFELAQQLVGIYKRENKTKSATIKNIDFVSLS